jgi:Bacterial HORMA domain family 1
MSYSRSQSSSSTFTEARVREVMKPVFDDITGLVLRNFISSERAMKWREDLTYMLSQEAISAFELQLEKPDGTRVGFRYEVSDDGSLLDSSSSGGLRLYQLPEGTTAVLMVVFRELSPDVRDEVSRRGWVHHAVSLSGEGVRERGYSHEGYGVIRKRFGEF